MSMESLYQVLGVKKADVDGMLSLKGSTAGALAVGLSKKNDKRYEYAVFDGIVFTAINNFESVS